MCCCAVGYAGGATCDRRFYRSLTLMVALKHASGCHAYCKAGRRLCQDDLPWMPRTISARDAASSPQPVHSPPNTKFALLTNISTLIPPHTKHHIHPKPVPLLKHLHIDHTHTRNYGTIAHSDPHNRVAYRRDTPPRLNQHMSDMCCLAMVQ